MKRSQGTRLGELLRTSKLAGLGEIVCVFGVASLGVLGAARLAGDDPLLRHGILVAVILLMIALIWGGLRLRGQSWDHFGLSFSRPTWRSFVRTVLLSIPVFLAATIAFIAGAVVIASIVGRPESADWSGYDYLLESLPRFIAALLTVYVTASFGEELIYRGFLLNRLAELGSDGKLAWSVAVLVSGLAFGVTHGGWGLAGVVQASLMGLALGVGYLLVGRKLWVTILAHAYMDTLLFAQVFLAS